MSSSKFKLWLVAYAKAFVIGMVVYSAVILFWPPGDSLSWTDWFQEGVPFLITVLLGDYFYGRALKEMQ